jgi:4-hydroxybenzoate polyprenyltransferase
MKSLRARVQHQKGDECSSVNRLQGFFTLLRLRHTGQVVGIVTVLSLKSVGFTLQAVLSITAALLLSTATFMFDDAHDESSDRIVHTQRPIPQGIYSGRQVYLMGILALGTGFGCAALLQTYQTLIYLFAASLSVVVIFLPLASSLRAILSAASIFLLFPFSTTLTLKTLVFGLAIALPHIAGSIVKDFLHTRGDQQIGLQTPVHWASPLSSALFTLSAAVLLMPAILQLVPELYVLIILPAVGSSLILSYNVIKKQYQKVYIYGGIAMVSTLLAVALYI